MSADAVALFRPKNADALRPLLDLDDDDDSDGLYAEELEDGSFLVHTFQPFAVFQADVDEGRAWLSQLGEAEGDPRGVLFFPDTRDPEGRTYDAIVSEMEDDGVWISATPLSREEATARKAELAKQLAEAQKMVEALTAGGGLDANDAGPVQDLARKLLAQNPEASTSFGAAKMIEDVQKQLLAALGIDGGVDSGDHVVVLVRRKTELEVDEDDVEDAYRLDDGSTALHTFVPLASRDALVSELAGPRAEWVAEHDDPRGVPTFVSAHLDDLTDVTSYEDVLERLGDHVTFVRPR